MAKLCGSHKCKRELPEENYHWQQCERCRERGRVNTGRWRKRHLAKAAEYSRGYQPAWRKRRIAADPSFLVREAANLRRQVLARTLRQYSLTQDQYEALVAKGCAICGGPPNGRGRYHFDHDHKTDKFRGLLCTTCNSGLGHFKDSRDLLVRAVQY